MLGSFYSFRGFPFLLYYYPSFRKKVVFLSFSDRLLTKLLSVLRFKKNRREVPTPEGRFKIIAKNRNYSFGCFVLLELAFFFFRYPSFPVCFGFYAGRSPVGKQLLLELF